MSKEKKDKKKKAFIKWLISSTVLVGGATGSIISIVPEKETEEEDENKQEKDLNKIISKVYRNLDDIGTNEEGKPPTEIQIKNLLKKKLNINIEKIKITNITSTSSKIESLDNNIYTGFVNVSYKTIKIINFSEINNNLTLEFKIDENENEDSYNSIIKNNSKEIIIQKLKEEKIVEKINPKNINTNVNEIKKTIEITSNNNNIYIGKLIIKYNFKKLTNLEEVINDQNLGIVYTNNNSPNPANILEIKNALINKFNIINVIDKINITNITRCEFSVSSSQFYGVIPMKYDIFYNYFDLKDLVSNDKNTNKVEIFKNNINFSLLSKDINNNYFWIKNNLFLPNLSNKIPYKFIYDLENKLEYKASFSSLSDFKKIENNINFFKNFNELDHEFYKKKLSDPNNNNNNWKEILKGLYTNNIHFQEKLKIQLLRFYNIMSKIYGKERTLNVVKIIELSYEDEEDSIGCSHFPGNDSNWTKKVTLFYKNMKKFNNDVDQVMWTIVHEYGHMLDFIITKNWDKSEANEMIDLFAEPLGISNNEYKKLLAYGIVRSNYGRTSLNELFAEAFAQWIITPEKNRDLAWEKLDNFFRIYLPQKFKK